MDKSEVKRIVKDEIKRFITRELDGEISKILKGNNSKARKETIEITKEGLSKLAEFLWIRRNVWKGDIR